MTPEASEALSSALAAASGLTRLFDAAGHRLYLVGGVVREAVAGQFLSGADLDFTTDARPASVRRIVSGVATSLWTQGERFGTIGCVVDGRAVEITTHRAEHYERHSRKPVVAFGDDVIQDLARRDFTVNAMAIDTADGTLIDPYGGRDDLAAGVLRTPLEPLVSFGDDPLRMVRAARFIASHGLVPDDAVVGAVQSMGDRLDIVAVERVRDEFEKLLLLDDPSEGLRFLFHTGLIERVIEELAPRDPDEVSRTAAAVAAEPASRWASLLVDHSAETAAACLRRLRCSNAVTSSAAALIAARTRLASTGNSWPDVRRFVHACPVPADAAIVFAQAVATARGDSRDRLSDFADTLAELRSAEDVDHLTLPVDGDEVMAVLGLGPGPAVGRALAFLRERALEEGPPSKAAAVEALQRWRDTDYGAEP